MDSVGIPLLIIPPPHILFDKGGDWTYQAAATPGTALDLETPGSYLFGVRAVDEAGAEEPFLDFGRNAFMFTAMANGGFPTVTLDCLSGDYVFRGDTAQVEVTVPADRDLECEVTCSAEEYGESCADMRWGLDIADLDTDEGWTPWSTDFTLGPIRFPKAGIHVLYVQVRDTLENSTLATLILNVAEFPLDKEVLWVDDSSDDLYPSDSEDDAFWRRMFDGYGEFEAGDVSEFHSFLDNDRGSIHPRELKLADLGGTGSWSGTRGEPASTGTPASCGSSAVMPSPCISRPAGSCGWTGGWTWPPPCRTPRCCTRISTIPRRSNPGTSPGII